MSHIASRATAVDVMTRPSVSGPWSTSVTPPPTQIQRLKP